MDKDAYTVMLLLLLSYLLPPQLSELQERATGLSVERTEEGAELERERTRLQAQEVDLERLGKDLATAKDRETALLEDR